MSGGLAYVYDPEKRMPDMCNEDVVWDLLPLADVEVRCATLPEYFGIIPSSSNPLCTGAVRCLLFAHQYWPGT